MKKQRTTDAKRAAANDKPEVENDKPKKADPKAEAEKPVERYTIGQTDTVRRGFLKEFCDFIRKNNVVSVEQLVSQFSGRTIDKHPINPARVNKYISYARNHGHIKVVKNAGGK
jgi:TPP-dependent 2-oxoacid decarboxylase